MLCVYSRNYIDRSSHTLSHTNKGEHMIQYIAYTIMQVAIGVLLFIIMVKVVCQVKRHGITNILLMIHKGCGDICYGPRWVKKSLEKKMYGDEYDRDRDYEQWRKENFNEMGED